MEAATSMEVDTAKLHRLHRNHIIHNRTPNPHIAVMDRIQHRLHHHLLILLTNHRIIHKHRIRNHNTGTIL